MQNRSLKNELLDLCNNTLASPPGVDFITRHTIVTTTKSAIEKLPDDNDQQLFNIINLCQDYYKMVKSKNNPINILDKNLLAYFFTPEDHFSFIGALLDTTLPIYLTDAEILNEIFHFASTQDEHGRLSIHTCIEIFYPELKGKAEEKLDERESCLVFLQGLHQPGSAVACLPLDMVQTEILPHVAGHNVANNVASFFKKLSGDKENSVEEKAVSNCFCFGK